MQAKIAADENTIPCLIANLISEINTPCPCDRKSGIHIEGTNCDGKQITLKIDADAGIIYIDGMNQEEADKISKRRCPICPNQQTDPATSQS